MLLVLSALAISSTLISRHMPEQSDPFAKEVAAFSNADRINPPAKGQVLFIGSSSFTKWTDVGDYFPNVKILNRAFGGSALPDVIRHLDEVVYPYKPRQVVIYCGENDFAGDSKLEPAEVVNRFKTLFRLIRNHERNVPIIYVSMKPSPSRWQMRAKFQTANAKIADFLKHQRKAEFLDVWPVMLNGDGVPKPEIFLSDRLHMNATGYHLWQPLLEPLLVKQSN